MRKRIIIAAGLALLVLASAGAIFMHRHILKNSMATALSYYGFDDARIGSVMINRTGVIYHDIKLDKDEFSSIETLLLPAGWKKLFFIKPFDTLIIDNLNLTGEWLDGTFTISGWKPFIVSLPRFGTIILNSAQLDLLTPEGGISLLAKGKLERQPDGTARLAGALWGTQHQLRLSTRWTGLIRQEDDWVMDIEFDEAALNLDKIQTSRVTGWLTLKADPELPMAVSSQISAGKVQKGSLSLLNTTLTINGTLTDHNIIITGETPGEEPLQIAIDIKVTPAGLAIDASAEGHTLDALIAFLRDLQDVVNNDILYAGTLTSLLLTEGNFDRLQKTLSRIQYDTLTLEIYGPAHDLAGKIVAKSFKNGVAQSHVISLNPATAN